MQLKIDEAFAEKVISANDSVRLLDKIVEGMDLRTLMRAYDSHGRGPATPPHTLLKVVLYAGMEHIYSSRKIHSACLRDINYIWLLDGVPAPSHFEIMVDHGRITQRGKHEDLMKEDGIYRRFVSERREAASWKLGAK